MRSRVAAPLIWSMFALSLALTVLGTGLLVYLNHSYPGVPIYHYWAHATAITIAFSTMGAFIVSRRPEHRIGWLFCMIGFLVAVDNFCGEYATYALLANPGVLPAGEVAAWIRSWIWIVSGGFGVFLVLLFPDERLASSRWRYLAWLNVFVTVLGSIVVAFSAGPIDAIPAIRNPLGTEALGIIFDEKAADLVNELQVAVALSAAVSLLLRLRRAELGERQQIKWFAYAALVLIFGALLSSLAPEVWDVWWVPWVGLALYIAGIVCLPVAVGIAILRYHLYDIDLIINRTLVYGALTVSVVALYVLLVGTIDTFFRGRGGLAVSLVAAGVVAVVFAPLRERLQRSVNHLMYGERDDPYAVLSRMGRRLEATIAPKAALSTIVETIAQALKVPYVAIEIRQDAERFAKVAEHGTPKEEPLVLPLVYQRETSGRLVVAPRALGETFSPADRRLLEDLARQVEVAVHAVRLTADLQRSRERLVTAREEERRRLRRDLHDGLGPTLGALTLGLDTTRLALAQDDPKAVDELLVQLKSHTQDAVSDVRRLVYGLRPPALDDLGLVPAIRQQAANRGLLADAFPNGQGTRWENSKNVLVFRVEAPDDLPSLPAAVEVACYRIAQEAITNTARHSGASSCLVSLCLEEADGTLQLEVSDDGKGVAEDRSAGVGMSSMRERAEELGGALTVGALPEGGTRVLARLPLPARDVPREEKRSS